MMDDDDELRSSPPFRYRWDVFLSFRGEDTREEFTKRLYWQLTSNDVRTFRDDEELERGEEIAPSLLEAIEDSYAAIAVISKRYANSRWCLEELATVVEYRKLLLPVFYEVDPSDVRKQKGPFEQDFFNLEQKFGVEKVSRWRRAMEKAGGISGWDSKIWHEEQLIQSLVKKVLTKLSNTPLGAAKYPVGLDSQLEKLMRMLDVKANGVRVLGFYGMGGVGKTTLSKALYNKLVIHFKRRSFISNIRETWRHHNGLMDLQNKLIGDLSANAAQHVNEVSQFIIKFNELIHEEPVLIVLDDVDDVRQLDALAGKRNRFYDGSRIIITTRDKGTLVEGIVDTIYEVKELNFPESLQLFSYHAFGKEKPAKDFVDLSKQIVSLAGGLPLALEIFGSSLFYKRTIRDWEGALQKLKLIRPGNLHDILQISFDGLDEEEKCVFLDIACFFVKMRMRREDAIDILRGCGFSAEIVLTVLTGKCMIKFLEDNILWMHDQLRDMGRQLVQQGSLGDPGQWSRLWDRDDILTVLKNKKGTRNIQGIALDIEKKKHELSSKQRYWMNFKQKPTFTSAIAYLKEIIYTNFFPHVADNGTGLMLHTNSFKAMVSLRLLQINHVKLNGSFRVMPAELKWLQWRGSSLKTLPFEFFSQHIAVLDLAESKITKVWEWRWWNWITGNKITGRLLVINLCDCYRLTEIPDLSDHSVLEKLILENCKGLVKIHQSIGDLSKLLHLNLKNCSNLAEFPSDVSGLKRLENLILSGCSKLKELPEDMSSMISLRELLIDETAIVKLPDSIFRLKKLEIFSLKKCWSLKRLPDHIGKLSSLKELSLDSSALEELPYSIGSLAELEKLNLMRCKSLAAIPDSIGNLKSLEELLFDCSSIKELPASVGSLSHLKNLSLGYCRSLSTLPDSIEGLSSLVQFRLEGTLIKEVPVQIGALNLVKKLEMGNCGLIKYLPQSIGKMLSITTLVLDEAGITELPESIGMLENLIMLKLNKCRQLQRLPSSIGNLKSLQYLLMAETSVTDLPDEFGMLSSLIKLKMRKEPHTGRRQDTVEQSPPTNANAQEGQLIVLPRSFSNLSSLEELDVHAWKLSGIISDEFEKLSSLEVLDLGHNNFCSLPSSLRGLSILKDLVLSHCKYLKSLPPFPSSLLKLDVTNCSALENISDLSNLESLHYLNLTNCTKIMDIPGLQCLKSLRRLYLSGCNACFPAAKTRLAKVALKYLRNLSVPGSEIPNWFVQEIPRFACRKNRAIKGIIIGVVVSLDQSIHDDFRNKLPAIVDIQAKILRLDDPIYTTTLYLMGVPETDEDQLYLCRYVDFSQLVLLLQDGDKIQIATRERPYFNGLKLKKYGIHLVFENDDDTDDNDDEESLHESQQSVSMKLAKFIGSL
ncbi:hypothetical protein ACOSP7_018180 [Xanthoceras sorbifolium]